MTITVTVPTLPSPPNSGSPSNFNALADAWCQALVPFGAALNTLAAQFNAETGNINTASGLSNKFVFDTTTTNSDPGAGKLRLNNATQSSAGAMFIDLADANAVDVTNVIALWDDSSSTIKGYVKLQHATDLTKWMVFSIASLTNPGGYYNVVASPVAFSSASPFANGDSILVSFTRNGDQGPAWTGGAIANRAYTTPVTYTMGATITIDASLSNVHLPSAAQNTNITTFTINNPVGGQSLAIRFVQDGTGGRTITLPGSVKAAGSIGLSPGSVSWLNLIYVTSLATWEGAWTVLP